MVVSSPRRSVDSQQSRRGSVDVAAPAEALAAGTSVWLKGAAGDEAFERATVLSELPDRGHLVRTAAGVEREVRAVECSLANAEDMVVPDTCQLIHLSESTILANLRQRFGRDEIYTFTGSMLTAMNPFQELPLYGEERMEGYAHKTLTESAQQPHVYAIAEEAFRCLCATQKPQSLVVSGESGAGKTETNKHCMRYLAWRAQGAQEGGGGGGGGGAGGQGGTQGLEQKILQSNPVLEAFGNAKTSRNSNSSRFGKFVKVRFSPTGAILGAATVQYDAHGQRGVLAGP